MPELSGPLQHVEISSTLWLIPLFPLIAAIVQVAVGVRRARDPRGERRPAELAERDERILAGAGVAGMALAFAASFVHLRALVGMPADGRYLLEHLFRLVRIGQLDANADLAL